MCIYENMCLIYAFMNVAVLLFCMNTGDGSEKMRCIKVRIDYNISSDKNKTLVIIYIPHESKTNLIV